MPDRKGKLIRVGDRLDIGEGWVVGVVVCSMDTGDYSPEHPKWLEVLQGERDLRRFLNSNMRQSPAIA